MPHSQLRQARVIRARLINDIAYITVSQDNLADGRSSGGASTEIRDGPGVAVNGAIRRRCRRQANAAAAPKRGGFQGPQPRRAEVGLTAAVGLF